MNTPVLFLFGAVALSALGGLVVWIASRPRPERFGSTIDTFSRDLSALAPPVKKGQRSGSRRTGAAGAARRVERPQARRRAPGPKQRPASTSAQRPGPQPARKPNPRSSAQHTQPARPAPGPRPQPRPGPRPTAKK